MERLDRTIGGDEMEDETFDFPERVRERECSEKDGVLQRGERFVIVYILLVI